MMLAILIAAALFDGTYTGILSCPAFPNQTPFRAEISVTVVARAATYQTTETAGGIGVTERGSGTVSESGKLVLSGGCEGGFSCVTDYRGDLRAKPILLTGSQRWWFRSGERERTCEVNLTRAKS
jgi:hypothetical protein